MQTTAVHSGSRGVAHLHSVYTELRSRRDDLTTLSEVNHRVLDLGTDEYIPYLAEITTKGVRELQGTLAAQSRSLRAALAGMCTFKILQL